MHWSAFFMSHQHEGEDRSEPHEKYPATSTKAHISVLVTVSCTVPSIASSKATMLPVLYTTRFRTPLTPSTRCVEATPSVWTPG